MGLYGLYASDYFVGVSKKKHRFGMMIPISCTSNKDVSLPILDRLCSLVQPRGEPGLWLVLGNSKPDMVWNCVERLDMVDMETDIVDNRFPPNSAFQELRNALGF